MVGTSLPHAVLGARYALDELLSRGPAGIAWRGTDVLLQRPVTVYLVHPRLGDDPAFAAALDAALARAAAVTDRRVARLLDWGVADGVRYVVRERPEGASLRARIAETGPLSVTEATFLVRGVLASLSAVHTAGSLHLALEPGSVVVTPDGEVVVDDLGLGVTIAAARPRQTAELLGPDRLAPEHATGAVDVRTDVYGVGALAFELLTGEPPRGRTSVRALRHDVPRWLDRAIARALDPLPDGRFADVDDLARAFGDAPDEVVVIPEAGGGRIASWLGIAALVAGLAAGMVALGLWLGALEIGGPLGIRPAGEPERLLPSEPIVRAELPTSAVAVDAFGDPGPNAPRAVDGDPDTLWPSGPAAARTPAGLLLDLGRTRRVLGLRLWTPTPGFQTRLAVGEDPDALVGAVGEPVVASELTRVALDSVGRYVLVWIGPTDPATPVQVAEVRVVVLEDADA